MCALPVAKQIGVVIVNAPNEKELQPILLLLLYSLALPETSAVERLSESVVH